MVDETSGEDEVLIPEQYLYAKTRKFDFPMVLVWLSFTLILMSVLLSGIAGLSQPPDSSDYTTEGYAEVLGDYNDKIFTFNGLSSLLMNLGVVTLGAGLLSLSLFSADAYPKWVRVALVAGTMIFLIRLFTTDMSMGDTLAWLQLDAILN